MVRLFKTIEALMILHNICKDLGDRVDLIPEYECEIMDEDDAVEAERDVRGWAELAEGTANARGESDATMRAAGRLRRLEMLNLVCPL